MTQPLWETIFADLDDLDTASDPVVRLNFAHLSTIMPMLRALGVYKDVGLKSRDWPARERLWKTSTIGAFASNLAVFMFRCNNTEEAVVDGSKEEQDGQVLVLHQERPVALEVCGGLTVCPLTTFLQVVAQKLKYR